VCAQQHWHWRPRPSIHGKTTQAGARPSFTTVATASGDDSDCRHDLNIQLQRGKGSRSYGKHSKHEHELVVSQSATRRRPTTMRRRHASPRIDDDDSDYPSILSTAATLPMAVDNLCVVHARAKQKPSARHRHFDNSPLPPTHDQPPLQIAKNSHTIRHYTRWERLQSRALPSRIDERWLAAPADGRKCLLRGG
jgi:hypothetical protein